MLDLYRATRDDLIRVIEQQRQVIEMMEHRLVTQERELSEVRAVLATVTAQLGAHDAGSDDDAGRGGPPSGMPGLKPTQAEDRAARPRKRRPTGHGRHRMQPTTRVVHRLSACPDCGAPLAGGTVKRTREVLDLPPPALVVTEHVYLERRCPDCGRRCVPTPDLGSVVHGRGRIGHGLTSLIAVLREEARLPFGTIQRLLATLTGVQLSVGALVDAVARVAARAEPVLAQLAAAIRASPVVHADETGWREAGRNGYVWTFSSPEIRLFRRGSRAKGMVSDVLGGAFAGVLVSDFYAAYTGDDGTHQYCWAHLLRDIDELVTQHPADAALAGWAAAVRAIFTRAQAASGSQTERWRVRRQVQADLRRVGEPWLDPRVAQTPLCVRITRYLERLFVFVTEPGVPATNNAAERSLRHLVVARKISGGTRSARGTATKMTLASLFGTWRAQGRNPSLACRDLLASPQV